MVPRKNSFVFITVCPFNLLIIIIADIIDFNVTLQKEVEMACYGLVLVMVLFFTQPNFKKCLFDYIYVLYSSLITEEMISICT